MGQRCALAIDAADRHHTAYILGEHSSLRYRRRQPGGSLETASQALIYSPNPPLTTAIPLEVDIEVDRNYHPSIAYLLSDGTISVWSDKDRWTSIAGDAHTGVSHRGIDLSVAGSKDFRTTGLVYTNSSGQASYLHFNTTTKAWSAPSLVTTPNNSGTKPKLVEINTVNRQLVSPSPGVVVFNRNGNRLQLILKQFELFGNPPWSAPGTIAELPNTSISFDAAAREGALAVAYSKFEEENSSLHLALNEQGNLLAAEYWTHSTVANQAELDGALDFFNHVHLEFDAAGAALVAYTQESFALLSGRTETLRMKRQVAKVGWHLSLDEPQETALNEYVGGLSLAVNGAGDPIIIYEEEQDEETSVLMLLTPETEPWVVGGVPGVGELIAPAIARGPDGAHYLVAGQMTTRFLSSPSFGKPVVLRFHRGRQEILETPGGAAADKLHLAHALTVTADNAVYFLSLQLSNPGDSSGRLTFGMHRGGLRQYGSLFLDGENPVTCNRESQIALGSSQNELYALFVNNQEGGTLTLARLNPAEGLIWETVRTEPSGSTPLDLAVRDDGGIALITLTNDDLVKVTTNVSHTGSVGGFTAFSYSTSGVPSQVTCGFLRNGSPYAASLSPGSLFVSFLSETGHLHGYSVTVPDGESGGLLDSVHTGSALHFLVQNKSSNALLYHLVAQDDAELGIQAPRLRGQLDAPPLTQSSYGDRVAATLDENGFPVATLGVQRSNLLVFSTFHNPLLVRPANALEPDHDGVPILSENAHLMNPYGQDAHLLPQADIDPSTVTLGFHYRCPRVTEVHLPAGHPSSTARLGAFQYSIHESFDLKGFSPIPGSVPIGTPAWLHERGIPIDAEGPVQLMRATVRPEASFQSSNPKAFLRLHVTRLR
ncbi:hypothetical protein [Roseibacillus ishigakijimensis]|uniref:Uncharacterized protein n=1 Tax=Roseibacillus ishigakijimensis TaxID=454146 RepID=A0A934VNB2_9BACT|nr:hypothetical protein [Roseibacillus ishigakijimensis]MBK1834931.1 hypothetical protein [Roseibacillus ishigakijimensis]